MKALLYLLTFLFGFFGAATVLRAVEVTAHGEPFPAQSVFVGMMFILIALGCMHKARGGSEEKN